MGLLSAVAKRFIDGSGTDADESATETFEYRCVTCETTFSLPKDQMVGVTCPECDSPDVRAADD